MLALLVGAFALTANAFPTPPRTGAGTTQAATGASSQLTGIVDNFTGAATTDINGRTPDAHNVGGASWATFNANTGIELDGSGNVFAVGNHSSFSPFINRGTAVMTVSYTISALDTAQDNAVEGRRSNPVADPGNPDDYLMCYFTGAAAKIYYHTDANGFNALTSVGYTPQAGDVLSCALSDSDATHTEVDYNINAVLVTTTTLTNTTGAPATNWNLQKNAGMYFGVSHPGNLFTHFTVP